jgi:tRNA(fMet)-specific endonuclease VapC
LAVRVALDTNAYVDLCRGVNETVRLLEEAELVIMPFVVLGELRAGFGHGRRPAENEGTLRRFLLKDGVRVIFADDQTTHHYAGVFRQLRKQRTPIPTNDIWLASLVLQHNLALHSRDAHFEHLPQLVRI